jgi:hypothetical protein
MLISHLSKLYDAPSVNPTDQEVADFRRWIDEQFWRLPVPVDFFYEEISLDQAIIVYENSGILPISVLNNDHPFLTFRENARFRAVHDWHHIQIGADASMRGEIATFKQARRTAPRSIHWILFSEIVLQAAACLHHDGVFQPQKFVKVEAF